ncbi:MAG: hypothetical protein H7Z42_02780 [Roseiflexaceae bacterium]|nr:hypothetical protein [Roseiflexaceae bacterium]
MNNASIFLDTDHVEEQIAWLRSLRPESAVEEIAQLLTNGAAEDLLWAAGALAAARHLNNQARNLLGFVSHAMIGCEDARRLAHGQPRHTRWLLIIQALYQVVCDLHDPCFAPSALPPFWPTREQTLDDSLTQLRADVRFGEYMRADHRLSGLAEDMPRAALVDLLLDIGLEGMITDDHTLITPVLSLGMVDFVGWKHGFDMLRWGLRYSASFPREFCSYDRARTLRESYGLEHGAPEHEFQAERVAGLCAAFHAAAPAERPELAARALARQGCSPATVLAAVSLVAADCYLMTEPVPHGDYDAVSREVAPMHINTTTNVLREALQSMSPATQALAAIQGGSLLERGPSVLDEQFRFVAFVPSRAYPYEEDVRALAGKQPAALLETLRRALPAHDQRTATAAVAAYAVTGASPEPLISLLIAVACTDNGTLLHNFKHLHATVQEFYACKLPDRWNFLLAGTRFIAWYAGVTTEAYKRATLALELTQAAALSAR